MHASDTPKLRDGVVPKLEVNLCERGVVGSENGGHALGVGDDLLEILDVGVVDHVGPQQERLRAPPSDRA